MCRHTTALRVCRVLPLALASLMMPRACRRPQRRVLSCIAMHALAQGGLLAELRLPNAMLQLVFGTGCMAPRMAAVRRRCHSLMALTATRFGTGATGSRLRSGDARRPVRGGHGRFAVGGCGGARSSPGERRPGVRGAAQCVPPPCTTLAVFVHDQTSPVARAATSIHAALQAATTAPSRARSQDL